MLSRVERWEFPKSLSSNVLSSYHLISLSPYLTLRQTKNKPIDHKTQKQEYNADNRIKDHLPRSIESIRVPSRCQHQNPCNNDNDKRDHRHKAIEKCYDPSQNSHNTLYIDNPILTVSSDRPENRCLTTGSCIQYFHKWFC